MPLGAIGLMNSSVTSPATASGNSSNNNSGAVPPRRPTLISKGNTNTSLANPNYFEIRCVLSSLFYPPLLPTLPSFFPCHPHHAVCRTPTRTYKIVGESSEEVFEWVLVLQQNLQWLNDNKKLHTVDPRLTVQHIHLHPQKQGFLHTKQGRFWFALQDDILCYFKSRAVCHTPHHPPHWSVITFNH